MSRTKPFKVGVIGGGKRAASYFRNIPPDLATEIQLAAVADPDPRHREAFASLFGAGLAVNGYDDGPDMFEREELDAVIIASPNAFHARDLTLALQATPHILLEKPVAISVEDCRDVWEAAQSLIRPPSVAVGFVLRYTPFYAKVKSIVSSGDLGSILAIDADENLGTDLTGLYHKGWRRDDELSGGFMVEKCCHDFDILNWITQDRVERVFSMAKRTHLVPEPGVTRHDRFDSPSDRRADDADFGDREINETFFTESEGSFYDFPSDSPDHQAVMLDFGRGVLGSFMACMGQPRTTRRIRIFGTDGALEGDIDDGTIVVRRPHAKGNGWSGQTSQVDAEQGNHHGGDAVLGDAFWRTVVGEEPEVRAGLREGIEAVLVAIAAQRSSASGQPVEVGPLHERVFGGARTDGSSRDA